ncbi:hypothetical protein P5V15_009298 [Pogonomyrmex californicus]
MSPPNIIDFNVSSIPQGVDENVLLVDLKSLEPLDISSKRENGSFLSKEPVVKISSPTPLKKPPRNDAVTIAARGAEEQHALLPIQNKFTMKKVDPCKELESLNVPPKNSIIPHDGSGDGRVYSKRTCPFHRYEREVKIFDDDIERYLTEDPRASMSPEQKLDKLPHLQSTPKDDKGKNRITSAKDKKIEKVTIPRKVLENYPDDTINLDTNRIEIKSKSKKNEISNKQCNFKSGFHTSNFKFLHDEKLMKEKTSVNNLKAISLLSKSFQRNGIKPSDKITKSSSPQASEIQEKLINESE